MMEKPLSEKTAAPDRSAVPAPQPADGGIRIAALAAAAQALKPKNPETEKPAHPLPPCLRDVERQTD